MKVTFPLLIVLLLSSCTEKPRRHALPPEKLEAAYIALLERGEKPREHSGDSTARSHTDSLFRSFGTSEAEFRSSLDSYRNNPEKWKQFFEGVIRQIDEKQKKPPGKGPTTPSGAIPG